MLKKRLTVTDLRRLLQAAEKDGHGNLEVGFKSERIKRNGGYEITLWPIYDYSIESVVPDKPLKFFLNFEE